MQTIILISGFGGSGKSTVSTALLDSFDHAALVSADSLFQIRPFDGISEEGRNTIGSIKMKNCLSVIQNYLDAEYPVVIVDGLVWSDDEYQKVLQFESSTVRVLLFWLDVPLDQRVQNALKRNRDGADNEEWLRSMEKKNMELQLPECNEQTVFKLPIKGESVDETVRVIRSLL